MLAAGAKDETIARELGVSLRTCRRHIAEMMRMTGAGSRFQAGVLATQLGLLTTPDRDGTPVRSTMRSEPVPHPTPDGGDGWEARPGSRSR